MQSCCMYTIAIEIAAVRLLSDQTQSVTLLSFFLRSDVKRVRVCTQTVLCCRCQLQSRRYNSAAAWGRGG